MGSPEEGTNDCEFQKECEKAIMGECTHMEWRMQEGCGLRQFAILVGNKKIDDAFHLLIKGKAPEKYAYLVKALKMEEP